MSILFRTDASHEIGIGHLTRCMSIAKYLKKYNHNLLMLGPNKDCFGKGNQEFFTFWKEKKFSNEIDDFNFLIELAKEKEVKIIILDDYRIKNILSKSAFKYKIQNCTI